MGLGGYFWILFLFLSLKDVPAWLVFFVLSLFCRWVQGTVWQFVWDGPGTFSGYYQWLQCSHFHRLLSVAWNLLNLADLGRRSYISQGSHKAQRLLRMARKKSLSLQISVGMKTRWKKGREGGQSTYVSQVLITSSASAQATAARDWKAAKTLCCASAVCA